MNPASEASSHWLGKLANLNVIQVALGGFTESSPQGHLLASHHGQRLHFHRDAKLRPAVEHLEWHWKACFLRP